MAFPSTSVLSSFTGEESPLSEGGLWPGTIRQESGTLGRPQKTGGKMTFAGTVNVVEAYYSTLFAADQESYATIGAKQSTGGEMAVWLRIQNPGNPTTACGYQINLTTDAGTDTFQVWRLSAGGTWTQVTSGTLNAMTQEFSAGDSFGGTIVGNTITVYYKPSGGSWTQLGQGTDSNITGSGYIGAHLTNHTGTLDDFGGGEVSTVTLDSCLPDADVTTTGWTTTPLFSKVNDASDATVIQATAV